MDNPYRSPQEQGALRKPKSMLRRLAIVAVLVLVFLVLALLLGPNPSRNVRGTVIRNGCISQVRQVMLAVLNYEADHGQFPPAYTVDAAGKPLHSWRTLILPYMEEQALFEKIDLSKPWDDPVNAQARESCPQAYRCPGAVLEEGMTTYLAVVDPQGVMSGATPRKKTEVTDGTSRTMVLIDAPAAESVHWMSPSDADLQMLTGPAMNGEKNHAGGVTPVAFLDCHVKAMSVEDLVKDCRSMTTIAGRDHVEPR
ncbi:MAG: DUF1559 domain-containing protein [Pirellulales bacterium]